jgi:hypothetical protein
VSEHKADWGGEGACRLLLPSVQRTVTAASTYSFPWWQMCLCLSKTQADAGVPPWKGDMHLWSKARRGATNTPVMNGGRVCELWLGHGERDLRCVHSGPGYGCLLNCCSSFLLLQNPTSAFNLSSTQFVSSALTDLIMSLIKDRCLLCFHRKAVNSDSLLCKFPNWTA